MHLISSTLPTRFCSGDCIIIPVTKSSERKQQACIYHTFLISASCDRLLFPNSAMSRSNQRHHDEDANNSDVNANDNDDQRQADNDNDLSLNDDVANQIPVGPSMNLTSSNDNCGTSITDNLPLLACWSQHVAATTQFGSSNRTNGAFHTTTAEDTLPSPEQRRQMLHTILENAMRLCDNNDVDSSNNPQQSVSPTTTTPRRRRPHSSQSPDASNEQKSPDTQ
jgi:hypothetical protein